MNDFHLENLLRAAGRISPAMSEPVGDLADRVRRLHRRRRTRRGIGAGVSAVVLLVAAVWLVNVDRTAPTLSRPERAVAERGPHWVETLEFRQDSLERSGDGLGAAGVSSVPPPAHGQDAHWSRQWQYVATAEQDVRRLLDEAAQLREEAEREEKAVKQLLDRRKAKRQLAELRRRRSKPHAWVIAQGEMEKTAFLLVDWAETRRAQGVAAGQVADAYRQAFVLFPETASAKTARRRFDELTRKEEE